MSRLPRLFVVVFLLLAFAIPAVPASAHTVASLDMTQYPPGCETGVFGTGATWLICMPQRLGLPWKGDLVIFVHGYVSPFPERAPEIPTGPLYDPVPDLVNGMGYAFATTSFRTNGLAIKDGVADLLNVWARFKSLHGLAPSAHTYLVGFSEGGLITTQAIEQKHAQFAGGLAACGPIGDFNLQISHTADMRVVYDYYFKDIFPLPPTALDIPKSLMANWDSYYKPGIFAALAANPALAFQLLAVTNTPYDLADPLTVGLSVTDVLWYNVMGSNDARAKLHGIPYDNTDTAYPDPGLNAGVERYTADRNALAVLDAQYQTTGRLKSPLVTMHNVGDPVVPYEHEVLYGEKVAASGSGDFYYHYQISTPAYGHCNFTQDQIITAFQKLVSMAGN